MEKYQFLAGVGRALILQGDTIIGIGKTFTETSISFGLTATDIRGGASNQLFGRYFHDSSMSVTITDAMFNLNYVAAALGTSVESGGISLYESPKGGEAVVTAGQVTLPHTPLPYNGTTIVWYKKPSDAGWTVGTASGATLTIPSAQEGDVYCVKFFYQNEDAESITIKAQYVPKTLHLVLLFDLYSGSVAEIEGADRYGRLIVDIPQFQMDGSQDLSLTSTTAATVSLTGTAIAVDQSNSCEEDMIYGTMTQEIFNTKWQDSVVALAIANGTELTMGADDSETIQVYAVFGDGKLPAIKPNSAFTFAVEDSPASTVGGTINVGANTGVITTTSATAGVCVISASLTDYPDIAPALLTVTVAV